MAIHNFAIGLTTPETDHSSPIGEEYLYIDYSNAG